MNPIPSDPCPSYHQSREPDLSAKADIFIGMLRGENFSPAEIKSIAERMVSKISSELTSGTAGLSDTAGIAGLSDTDLGEQTYKKLLKFLQDSKKIKSTDQLNFGDISFYNCFDDNAIIKLSYLLTFDEIKHIGFSNNILEIPYNRVKSIQARCLGDISNTACEVLHTIKTAATPDKTLLGFMLSLRNSGAI